MVTTLLGVAFVLALIYPVAYARAKPWRPGNPVGLAAFTFSCMVAGVLGVAFARRAEFITLPSWGSVAIYLVIIAGLLFQDIMLLMAQSRRRVRQKRDLECVSDESREVGP